MVGAVHAVVPLVADTACRAVPSLRFAVDEAAQPQVPPAYIFSLPPTEAETMFVLYYALLRCAEASVQLAAAVAAAASSSQAWHLDFRIGRSEGVASC